MSVSIGIEKHLRFIDEFRKYAAKNFDQGAELVVDAVPFVFPAELDIEIRCDLDFHKIHDVTLLNVGKLVNIIRKESGNTLALLCCGKCSDGELAVIYTATVNVLGSVFEYSIQVSNDVTIAFDPAYDIRYVVGVLSYIQQPTIYADLIDVNESTQKSRKKHGKRPLPPYRVIRPGQTIVRHRPVEGRSHAGTGTGTPKCGHWRRDTKYVRKDGRVIYRRGCAVKGGPCDNRPVLVLPPNPVEWSDA
ncbi:hypothetical protein [Magnetospirillum sp. 15-1]|uniref:hypothetical protein n=1 Tax=Magnetospirillum sp. 15-1 TaxID=1979370 RepID=UPI0011439BF3|nr:hypothetical protein [Magnetospirillum sp. 15-1]